MLGRWEQRNKFILINKWSKMGWSHFKICGGRKRQLQNQRRAGTQGSTVTEWSRKCFKWPSLHQFYNATLLNFPKGGVVSWGATSEDIKLYSSSSSAASVTPGMHREHSFPCIQSSWRWDSSTVRGTARGRLTADENAGVQQSSSSIRNNLTPVTSPLPSHPTSSW